MMVELFVPGRLCLLGEHTDWAAGYPSLDGASFNVGEAIVTGIDQGLHARVSLLSPHDHDDVRFIFRSSSSPDLSLDVPIGSAADQVALLSIAVSGSPASYVAGCVHHLLSSGTARISNTAGVLIDNHTTTMPMQKGLSSSAAVCVLVVRAFNVLLDLGLSAEQEMELAYHGERTTPSQCGRLDQAGCAFGSRPVRLTFDAQAQLAAVVPIPLRCDLFFVIVDLGAHKDTRTILSDLNACFQSPAPTAVQLAVRAYLGHVSPSITVKAIEAMERGDPVALGALLTSAQAHFDTMMAPACPSQLTAPVLHSLLTHVPLQPLLLGAKGVGSQGDGTAQLLVIDAAAQRAAIELIRRDFPLMTCLPLSLKATLK